MCGGITGCWLANPRALLPLPAGIARTRPTMLLSSLTIHRCLSSLHKGVMRSSKGFFLKGFSILFYFVAHDGFYSGALKEGRGML